MKSSEVLSELVFLGNRVASFNLTTKKIKAKGQSTSVAFDFDYNIKDIRREGNNSFGLIDYIVTVKATVKKKVLFKIELVMEGAFSSETLDDDIFKEMVEVNGLITLSHLSRSYVQSVTAQSGFNPPVKVPMININKLIAQKAQTAATFEE